MVEWNHLNQSLIHSYTSRAAPFKFVNGNKIIPLTLYNGFNHFSMLGLNLMHVCKRGPMSLEIFTTWRGDSKKDNQMVTYHFRKKTCKWSKEFSLNIIAVWSLPSYASWSAYCQTSYISGTKSQNLNVSCLVLQLSLTNPLKPGVKLRMKMWRCSWSSAVRRWSIFISVINNFILYNGATYIGSLMVYILALCWEDDKKLSIPLATQSSDTSMHHSANVN